MHLRRIKKEPVRPTLVSAASKLPLHERSLCGLRMFTMFETGRVHRLVFILWTGLTMTGKPLL